ncbi:MAG: serine--tRNA ligase [Candidatus Moranbacteria bacterium]|nr:serine--tRNA ligase [Candidatus Moranbacteria bacterium]MBP9801211.1 serine--tRNA ligase [Candidatus Moranbacteria bacterium]
MLDIRFIRENEAIVREAISLKKSDCDLDLLLKLDQERADAQRELEELKSLKNDINDLIMQSQSPEERAEVIAKGKEIKQKIDEVEPNFRLLTEHFEKIAASVPNVVSSDTPRGKDEAENIEIFRSEEPKTFSFIPRDHIDLGVSLDILDFERGTKVAGYRGYYVKNEGALLVVGLMAYALQKMAVKGFLPMIPPTLIKEFPLFGSGYFKGAEYNPEDDEIYRLGTPEKESDGKVNREEKFLVGTSEPSLLAYYSGEVLDKENLPLRMSGFSQCYRSEIGSYGRDTKGLYRVHEFFKVEQVVLCTADMKEADSLQAEMLAISEEMHRELGIPYRKLQICTGDLGTGKYRQFDLEAWMPGLNRWGETGSSSNFLDWQSRRLNVKYLDKSSGERKYVYMLNNTALPSPRILIAILENYQEEDGSIVIPEVLRPYIGKDRIVSKK